PPAREAEGRADEADRLLVFVHRPLDPPRPSAFLARFRIPRRSEKVAFRRNFEASSRAFRPRSTLASAAAPRSRAFRAAAAAVVLVHARVDLAAVRITPITIGGRRRACDDLARTAHTCNLRDVGAKGTRVVAPPAMRQVGPERDLAAVARQAVAVGEPRRASKAAGASGARRLGIRPARAHVPAPAAARDAREARLAAVAHVAVAARPAARAVE